MDNLFINELGKHPDLFIATIVVVVFSICMHEMSHTWMARKCGDSTAWDNGYMTMNPLKLMGIPSIILLFVVGIAWGAVPVNPARLQPQWRRGLVSFAGPAANMLLAVFFAGVLALYTVVCDFAPAAKSVEESVNLLLQLGFRLNVMLAIFNMIPVPPLDGWDVFATFFPPLNRVNPEIRSGAMLLLFALVFMTSASFYVLQLPSIVATAVVCKLLGVAPYWDAMLHGR